MSKPSTFEEYVEFHQLEVGPASDGQDCPECGRPGMILVKPRKGSAWWWDDPASLYICSECLKHVTE